MALPLSPAVFSLLSGLVEASAGLHYGVDNLELFAEKVTAPALDAGFESLLDYYYFLRYDPAGPRALEKLIEGLLVHETYFFREADQLQVLVDQVLAPAVARGGRPRVWCAAAATGEEPLTLAMLLDERGLLGAVELVASDLSRPALDRAQRGEFGPRSLRSLPPGALGRWLDASGDKARVHARLKESITWRQANLIDLPTLASMGPFDAILCRNVLIYFDDATAIRVVETLGAALKVGGHLLVGSSESLLRFGTQLACEERSRSFFYTRAA